MNHHEDAKRAVGRAAAVLVESGMRLGLGTGSTTAEAIRAIGERVREDGLDVAGVPTSFAAERLARAHGVSLVTLDDVGELDLALDGADEVFRTTEGGFHLIKGRGAAHTRERIVAARARRFVVLVDESKLFAALGEAMPVPVEVLPMAASPILHALHALGAEPRLREGAGKDGPVVTDQGFWVIDAAFPRIDRPADLAAAIREIPGVLDHGLFLDMASDVLVGRRDGSVEHLRRREVVSAA